MSPKTQLKLASIAFGILWTAGMVWWNGVGDTPGMVIHVAMGTLAGIGWYFGMKFVSQRFYGRQVG